MNSEYFVMLTITIQLYKRIRLEDCKGRGHIPESILVQSKGSQDQGCNLSPSSRLDTALPLRHRRCNDFDAAK